MLIKKNFWLVFGLENEPAKMTHDPLNDFELAYSGFALLGDDRHVDSKILFNSP